jgi:hypothetical protein
MAVVATVAPVAPATVDPAAAAKFVDDGGAAGVNPATATGWGVDWVEGNAGVADRATTEASSGGFSCFHHAKRGADWQPVTAAIAATNVNDRIALRFMAVNARWSVALTPRTRRSRGGSGCSAATVRVFGISGL